MNFAIILSGGIGTRMHMAGFPKQYIEVCQKPILVYTLEKFQLNMEVDRIVVVAAPQWGEKINLWAEKYNIHKLAAIAAPGDTRQESILNGLETCMKMSSNQEDRVIIHDAVRPLVSDNLISTCLSALNEYEGCMPVLPLNDTIYQSTTGRTISNLLDRNTLFAGQAPEAFLLKKYTEINRNATKEELACTRGTTELAFKNGLNICLIPGEDINFKITTPADLNRFRVIVGGIDESV